MKRALILAVAAGCALASGSALAMGDAEAGKAKSTVCAGCHGADGNSTIPGNPRLAGQYATYIVRALSDYKSGARKNPVMAGFAAGLSDEDMHNLAAYFSSQKGLVVPTPE
ncbi:MAG: cytochrome c [Chromatiales bacterium]|nr:cytochrome c [Chromatiales bacterium]